MPPPRADRQMLRVNCAATPANQLDSIIFGHEKAPCRRVRAADRQDGRGGRIDPVPRRDFGHAARHAARLLDMLHTGAIVPLGARYAREVDVRVIAASDGRLLEAVEAGRFREDLYYKLNTVHVAIPPLRDRADDARARQHLLDRIAQQPGLRWLGITEDARPAAPL
jgi:transcriptional regulator with PAS, ATPase and Fis domain